MDWPEQLPGLDVHKALSNINGKTELYLKLLQVFIDNHSNDATKISQSVEAQDWQQAHMQAHSLKGVSSNIGAEQLAQACQAIEHKTKADPSDLQQDLLQLRESFSQAVASIESLLQLDAASE